jgi:hypothetical protein
MAGKGAAEATAIDKRRPVLALLFVACAQNLTDAYRHLNG